MTPLLLALALGATPDAGTPEVLPELRRLASALAPEVEAPWVKAWLDNAVALQSVLPSTAFCSSDKQRCQRWPSAGLTPRRIDDELVYARIADPLGYARAFELLAASGFFPRNAKVLDFGYGNLGHLLMLARLGAEVHGVEVDALLPLAARGRSAGIGSLTLHHGFFASDERLIDALGGGFDLWLSKNTLKRGYVHPDAPGVKPAIELGLDDAQVLALVKRQLAPGGIFFIYNVAAPRPGPYQPMADGRCPFSKQALVDAGFEVLAHDADDSGPARRMAERLEWARDWPDVGTTLVATYTLARRPYRE